jgi:hypothetical protein
VTERKIDGRTKRAADMALGKKQISRASYEAILRGELSLAQARALERDRGPHDTGQASSGHEEGRKTPREGRERPPEGRERPQEGTSALRTCLCGCGESVKNRFRPGHDMRLFGELKRNLEKDPLLRNERFNEEQRQYARERGLI